MVTAKGRRFSLMLIFMILVVANIAGIASLAVAWRGYASAANEAEDVARQRYESYLLATEFRQSSDDLTRLARTYAVTGLDKYEQQYNDIVAIRDGKKPRPVSPERIYWDFVAATGEKPRADGEAKPLITAMKEAGFSDAELGKLADAKQRSDDLVRLETRAMNAVKGLFADQQGGYTRRGEPDMKLARDLLHSDEYHRLKGGIMKPVDEFFVLLDNRTRGAVEAADARATRMGQLGTTLMIGVGLLLLATGLILYFRVIRPLRGMAVAMNEMASGHFDVEIAGADRNDEMGDMANAVERVKILAVEKARQEADAMMARQEEERDRQQKLADAEAAAQAKVAEERMKAAEEQGRAVDALGDGLQRLSNGELAHRLPAAFPESYRQIRDDFNAMADRMNEAMAAIKSSTQEVSNASAEIAASTTDLSQRTEEQAASLEETSASMEEIAATVKKNAENAQAANRSANSASVVSGRVVLVVGNAVDAMARIEESSRKISDIIGVIDEIARQTNLLALNAAVEAARAGEAGRGFAVVASEVRSLAQRSSQAAKDIKDLIVSSNGQVKDGVELVNKAGQSLSEIVDSIKSVASIVADIASASAEQAIGIAEVNKALTQMDEATQQNSALVEENAATAKTLETQAQAMNERVSFFQVENAPMRARAQQVQRAPQAKPAVARVKAAAPQARGPVGRMQTAVAAAFDTDQDWKEF